jgi:hypothetical protein
MTWHGNILRCFAHKQSSIQADLLRVFRSLVQGSPATITELTPLVRTLLLIFYRFFISVDDLIYMLQCSIVTLSPPNSPQELDSAHRRQASWAFFIRDTDYSSNLH